MPDFFLLWILSVAERRENSFIAKPPGLAAFFCCILVNDMAATLLML